MAMLHLVSQFAAYVDGKGVLGFGPAPGLGIVLVLASLALAPGPARADGLRIQGEIHVDDLLIRGGYEQIAPVPRHGLEVELWSDPEPGQFVRVGERVQLRFRTNESCYVTLISIDADGRARRLFPRRGDDGWVRGGRVESLPGRWDDYDLRFTGPVGEEYVFAIASREPLVRYYPAWLSGGWGPSWDRSNYRYGRSDLYDSGWCVGDPIPEIYRFTERLVPFPRRYETYAATWIRFDVGRRPSTVWRVCSDCGGRIGHGHDCGHGYIEINIGIGRGVCDFYRPCPPPRYRHVVCRTVEPRRWKRVFHEPVARWSHPADVDRITHAPGRSRDGKDVHREDLRSGKAGVTPDDYRRMREREGDGVDGPKDGRRSPAVGRARSDGTDRSGVERTRTRQQPPRSADPRGNEREERRGDGRQVERGDDRQEARGDEGQVGREDTRQGGRGNGREGERELDRVRPGDRVGRTPETDRSVDRARSPGGSPEVRSPGPSRGKSAERPRTTSESQSTDSEEDSRRARR